MNNQGLRVLIYGARKSGTTLLQRLIDGGEIYVYPTELKVKMFASGAWKNKEQLIDMYRSINKLKNESHPGFDNKKYLGLFDRKVDTIQSLRELIELDLSSAIECSPRPEYEYRGWVVKEVGGKVNQVISDWKKMFPDSKIIMIVRDPLFISSSVFRKSRRNARKLSWHMVYKQAADPWRVFIKQSKYAHRGDILIISYEQLVSDTSVVMHKVCEFLSIKYSDIFLKPTMFGEETVVRTSSKEVTSVFQTKSKFWEGLSLRETVIIICTTAIYTLIYRVFRRSPGYGKFSKSIFI
jgi:hypothetical protein